MKNKKRGSKLFRKYMLNMFAMILIALTIMSILFLTIETSRWRDDQTGIWYHRGHSGDPYRS